MLDRTGPTTRSRDARGFTIIELLVVVSIIALLIGILLPAIGKARDQAKQTISQANLRNLATAHASYAAEWADRQLTLVDDNIARYGNAPGPAFSAYAAETGSNGEQSWHPPVTMGWGYDRTADVYRMFRYFQSPGQTANNGMVVPIRFQGSGRFFGSFRIPNCQQFAQYVSGKFYDKVFYAPKDTVAWEVLDTNGCFESPDQYADCVPPVPGIGDLPAWSSYCNSPAGMYSPTVMSNPSKGGWKNPWELPAGFRSPSFSQALFPNLKTHMTEHHWLQARRSECNPNYGLSVFSCEPYYFNHAWESTPVTLFYDGHVESVGVRQAQRHDGRQQNQTPGGWGLWSRDTPFGEFGYLIEDGYDQAASSFHILTTDGIRGRDLVAD